MSAPIIITVPNYLAVEDGDPEVAADVAPATPSRKRRLDHLTWEEKMQRKKLKNRVAAQTSRDRKKAKMDEMDSKINHFMAVNERLVKEVEELKAMNERLLKGGAPVGDPRGTPVAGDVSPLADILAHLESEEYLDTLNQLADSLLKEIDASAAGEAQNESNREDRKCTEGSQMVGTPAKHLESSKGALVESEINMKHDVDRILEHSYAHPYPKTEEKEENGDKGDIFYASYEANDCVTIEVPSEEVVEETINLDMDFTTLTQSCPDLTLESDMKLLSPMCLSPKSIEENLGLSPSHTNVSSDLGYESLASPFSEPDLDLPDLSDFWCDSFSELFPALA
ncbi:unnamed protein product [Leptosia nina]|uniref:X-box-binding protein 1 n=1 Tax=Leptosia nina TaxID=320188 RepID=A0AAV1JSV1_9NEOP